jgi:alpha-L-rhamnosidase
LDDVEESQRDFGAYPDYAPYPMAHGGGKATHGTAWTDAGIICPWTIWKVYGDTRVIERHWDSMTRFMEWRLKVDPELKGIKIGNPWGDWLNVNEDTSIEFIDLCYHAYSCSLMADLAHAIGKTDAEPIYRERLERLRKNFRSIHIGADGALRLKTQSAHVLAIACGIFTDATEIQKIAAQLATRIEENGTRMATGFLGTKSILPSLTQAGQHDLACRLFQSRQFPSWGYEASNGATSVWERWDSYTKEHGFDGITGKNNAAMNSFSHYAFGAVMEWAYRDLVGIDTDGPGFRKIAIKPGIPSATLQNIDPTVPVVHWAKADFAHHRGMIQCHWKNEKTNLTIEVTIPANTSATVHLPVASPNKVSEGGKPLTSLSRIKIVEANPESIQVEIGSGQYRFEIAKDEITPKP